MVMDDDDPAENQVSGAPQDPASEVVSAEASTGGEPTGGEPTGGELTGTEGEARLVTFGCRMNTYESEVMRDHARAAGLSNAIIINTCAVTSEAERQARQTIRRLRRDNPTAEIIVTGCAAQVNPDLYAAMPEVSRVLNNDQKLQATSYRLDALPTEDSALAPLPLIEGFEGRTRAFVQVQQGCDHRCTFCIIPLARGVSRSQAMGPIVDQVRKLVANGYQEVTLTGVDITAYGLDLPGKPPLGQMVRRLLQLVPELPRLRLTSLDPVEIDADLLDLFGREPRLLPHVHLSVQAGHDLILKRMARRHLRADVLATCAALRQRRPDVTFGADLIAGFPTESEEMFAATLSLVDEAGLTHLHVFPYSSRPGTPAAKIPGLPRAVVKERAARLRAKAEAVMADALRSMIGSTGSVLMETETTGHCEHFFPVTVQEPLAVGTIADLYIADATASAMLGRPAPASAERCPSGACADVRD